MSADSLGVIRRYVAVIQDPRGYPAEGLDPAPPDGPELPMLYSVVKADEHEAAIRGAVHDNERLTEWLRVIAREGKGKARDYARAALDGFVYTGGGQ